MARTIAEIQNQILEEKGKQATLNGLTDNQSKTAIWRLWINIVATAIWIHEKIVEKNALISRPHTLNWYREQALSFVYGQDLIWKEGSYKFDTQGLSETEISEKKVVKHCAVSEVDLSSVINPDTSVNQIFSDYFHNQVGVVFIKVATESGGYISPVDLNVLSSFKEYIARIKDAGNQVIVSSLPGDVLKLHLNVFVDPLTIYIKPQDIKYYKELMMGNPIPEDYEFDPQNGALISKPSVKPVEKAIEDYLKNIEFNGAFVKSFLVDTIQKAEGVKIPVLKSVKTVSSLGLGNLAQQGNSAARNSEPLSEAQQLESILQDASKIEYFIPKAGYFDLKSKYFEIKVNYVPYTFYRDNRIE
ncbi:hypothetical protein ABGT15_04730 [Flavobacterium enshiense]|uniref:hypothetical protein n=1 Tax=Flavobacterium enshiense TaxID=1341165 RepID=UPI00345D6C7E